VKISRWIMLGVAVAVMFAAAANAAPATHLFLTGDQSGGTAVCEPSPSPSPTEAPSPAPSDEPSSEPSDEPSSEPSDEPSSEPCPSPSESESPSPSPSQTPPTGALTCPTPPPATTTGKLHGLENAIAHVYANCQAHPNQGLVNALNHLIANLATHQAHDAGKLAGSNGQGHGHSQDAVHGNSGTAPGHSKHDEEN
jgi:hypothetical protein